MEKKYTSAQNYREARPRSRRLREIGGGGAVRGAVTAYAGADGSAGTSAGGDGHTHSNLAVLESLDSDSDRYLLIGQLEADGSGGYERVKAKAKAGYADEAGRLAADSEDWVTIADKDAETLAAAKAYADAEKLSKTGADTAAGEITFLEGVKLGLQKLWGITKDGFATLRGLLVSGGNVTITKDAADGDGSTGNLSVGGDAAVSGETHLQTTTFGEYSEGRQGGAVVVGADGTVRLQTDYLDVMRAAYFREITIQELKHVGGEIALTAAAMVVSKVVPYGLDGDPILVYTPNSMPAVKFYRCYYETTDGKRQVYHEFVVGDQALCQQTKFDTGTHENVATKYYWRLVVGVGNGSDEDHAYIDLGNQAGEVYVRDTGVAADLGTVPEEGDNIVQLGYRQQAGVGDGEARRRQSAIILSATASNAPSVTYYQGIGSNPDARGGYWELEAYVVKEEGFSDEVFHSHTYGNLHVGDRDKGGGYMEYDAERKELTIQANLRVSTGKSVEEVLADMAKTNDQRFNIWFGEEPPYPNADAPDAEPNEPASAWTTDGDKAQHVQDLYFDRSQTPGTAGRNWRWEAVEADGQTTYRWVHVTDQETLKALELLGEVKANLEVLEDRIAATVTLDRLLTAGVRLGTGGILIEGEKVEFASHVVLDTVVSEASTEIPFDPAVITTVKTEGLVASAIAAGYERAEPMRSLTVKAVNIPYSDEGAESYSNPVIVLPFYDEAPELWSDECGIEWNSRNRFGILKIPEGTINAPASAAALAAYDGSEVQPWTTAGTRLSIACESDLYFGNWQAMGEGSYGRTDFNILASRAVVVCADGRLLSYGNIAAATPATRRGAEGSPSSEYFWQAGRFSCGGYVARFIVLLPGQSLQLRSQVLDVPTGERDADGEALGRKVLTWVVENAHEFAPLTARSVEVADYGVSFGGVAPAFSPTAASEATLECVLAPPVLNLLGTSGSDAVRDIVIPNVWAE